MSRVKDITGQTFGFFTVVSQVGMAQGCATWLCKCACGKEKVFRTSYLKSRKRLSCGCQRGTHRHTANAQRSRTFIAWENMHQRCYNPRYIHAHVYQSRGISVCERWHKFPAFLEDIGEHPGRGYSLDRIDNDGDYGPENCRWATRREQANNRVTNIRFEYQGKMFTIADLARHTGVSKETLRSRLCRSKKAWTVEDALTFPIGKGKSYKPT